ncbi:hypothetical protein [Pseudomonas panipatensis]
MDVFKASQAIAKGSICATCGGWLFSSEFPNHKVKAEIFDDVLVVAQ